MTIEEAWNYYNGGKIEKIIMNPNDYERFKRIENEMYGDNSKGMKDIPEMCLEPTEVTITKVYANEEEMKDISDTVCGFGPLEPDKKEEYSKIEFEIDYEEGVREDYQYSFLDAFRFLMKGHTIRFANGDRMFKIINGKFYELIEHTAGFSSKSMLYDKFYVEDKE